MHGIYLAVAIIAEVIGTSALKASDGFSRLVPSLIVVLGYSFSFYFLSLALRVIPLGISYAIWSGVGVVFISFSGWWFYKQPLDIPAMIGIAFIVLGVLILHLFSKSMV